MAELEALFDDRPNRAMRRLIGEDRRQYLQGVVQRLRANFLATLDEPYAIALAHDRHERNFVRLNGSIVDQRTHRRELDPDLLQRTPPGVVDVLQRTLQLDPDRSGLILQHLADHGADPVAIGTLMESTPDWLSGCAPESWIAIGHHAAAHGLSDAAGAAFAKARREGADTPTHELLARQALTHQSADTAAGLGLLDGDIADPASLLAGARCLLNEAPEPLISMWDDTFAFPDRSTQQLTSAMKCAGYFRAERFGEALSLLDEMVERIGERPWTLLHRAHAIAALADLEPFGSHEHQQLLHQALASVRTAIDLTQKWAGPTIEHTQLAIRIALATGQPNVILELGANPTARIRRPRRQHRPRHPQRRRDCPPPARAIR